MSSKEPTSTGAGGDGDLDQDRPALKRPRIQSSESGGSGSGKEPREVLTSAEAELYDRQIRLWGVEAQKRLTSSSILIIGMNGLGAELAKNLILGGVGSVHIMDPAIVTESDLCCQFFVGKDAVGKNRALASLVAAQRLNPMVSVSAADKSSTTEPDSFFTKFNVICSLENSSKENARLDRIARQSRSYFFNANVYGMFSFMAIDLGNEFKYSTDKKVAATTGTDGEAKKQTAEQQTKTIQAVKNYVPYENIIKQDGEQFAAVVAAGTASSKSKRRKQEPHLLYAFYILQEFYQKENRGPSPLNREVDFDNLLKLRDKFCKTHGLDYELIPNDLFEYVYGQLNPICAITGGVLAQEVVKAISERDEPICNLVVYNPLVQQGGSVHTLGF